MRKTIKDWFESIKDPIIRRNALKNMKNPDQTEETLQFALACSFSWVDSPEGMDYWSDIHNEFLTK